jgi:hypothetical protein
MALRAGLLRENLLETGDPLPFVGRATSQICPHSQSRLTQDDLCARLAPLDRYGLAELGSALVDGLLVVATWSKDALRARRTSEDRKRRFHGL